MNEDVKLIVNEAIAEHCDMDFSKHQQLREDFLSEIAKLNAKIDLITPTVKELEDFKSAYRITGEFLGGLIKIILGFGILWGGAYAIKEWLKK